jgi:hypothetical protein
VTRTRHAATVRDDGYAMLGGFLGPDELPALRADAERLVRSPRGAACERPHNTLVPMRWADAAVGAVLRPARRRARLARAAGAEDLRFVSAYLSLKEPHSPALWWHQDWWCWDHPASLASNPPQVAVLCYLDATDAANAALRVLPRSHRGWTALHAALPEAHGDGMQAVGAGHVAMADHPAQETLGVAAGDAVVIDYRLLHGTHANTTAARRDCLVLTFAPHWAALPADIRGHLIRHPALPADGEPRAGAGCPDALLPRFEGERRDLALNRVPPRDFALR